MSRQLTQQQQTLVLKHLSRAYAFVSQINRTNVPVEDLQQAAAEGVCRAALRYDEAQDAAFATYMNLYVFGEVLHTIDLILGRERYSIDDYATDDDYDDKPLITEPYETPYELIDNTKYVNQLIERLNPQERQIIELLFGFNDHEPLSLTGIAHKFNTYPAKISRIYVRAINNLRTLAHNPNF